ncbi:MAG: outer membrane protein transport protein [Ghiorsea sp.]
MNIYFLKKERLFKIGLAALLSCSFSLPSAYAAVFANYDLTPVGAGAANAVVAGTGSISDAIYNPAGLAWQDGVEAMIGSQTLYRNNAVELNGSVNSGDLNLPSAEIFAISWMPKGGSWGISGSLSIPYSAKNDWSFSFPTLNLMSLNMKRYSTDIIWRGSNSLGIAAGMDVYDTSLSLNTSGSSFSGSDWSDVGAHMGIRWEFTPFWTLGVHYRQGVKANPSNSVGDIAHINLPDEWSVGLAHSMRDDEILLELDVKRSAWSSFDSLNVSNNGVNSQTNLFNLKDTTDAMLGMTWYWRNDTQLRLGYAYEQGASQSAGYQPLLSDLTGYRISAGFGGMMATMHLDVTWTGSFYSHHDVAGAYAGRYTDSRNSFMFSLSKKF